MPEGDTVWHTAATLRQHLAGRTLTRCDIRVPRFATVDLTGQVVDEVLSRGKHLFIRVGRASIHSHLKMEGSWRVGNRTVRVDHRARIVLEANDMSVTNLVKTTVFLTDRSLLASFRAARDSVYAGHAPCSTLLFVAGLADPRLMVEIEAEAVA